MDLDDLESVGFFVIAPRLEVRRRWDTNLETSIAPQCIRSTVTQRIAAYEKQFREEAPELRDWEQRYFHQLVDRLTRENRLAVLSWEESITAINAVDASRGEELNIFYQRCLNFAPGPN